MSDVWSSLITNWAVNKVDSDPRRSRIDTIQDHHAASTSESVCLSLFAPGGRTVTPNVFIAGKRLWGIVPENRRAYTSGSPVDDHRSLTIEHLNVSDSPDWRIAVDTIISSVALHVDWVKRYGIPLRHGSPGMLEHRNINEWWGRSYATACAGPGWDMSGFIQQVAAAMISPAPEPEEDEEDMWKPTVHLRVTNDGKLIEGTLAHPMIGLDLKPGEQRKETTKAGVANVYRGFKASNVEAVVSGWRAAYAPRGDGNSPGAKTDQAYQAMQAAQQQMSIDLYGLEGSA